MKLVRLIKNWDWPDIFRQTPKQSGIWSDLKFTFEEIKVCDYVVVMNYSTKKTKVKCSPENVWNIQFEPPNSYFKYRHRNIDKIYRLVFTTDPYLKGERYIHTQTALPWHVNKDYDFLTSFSVPSKQSLVSCIVSLKSDFAEHKIRLNFIDSLRKYIKCDILATYEYYERLSEFKGLKKHEIKKKLLNLVYTDVVTSKWEGLVPYRYSVVIENYSGPDYWSEKLSDCFLAWTMPIYWGCTNIYKYFPCESLIYIDIDKPNVFEIIKKALKEDLWRKNLKYISKARNLVLNKYNFFPFVNEKIKEYEKRKKNLKQIKKELVIPNEDTFSKNSYLQIQRLIGKLLGNEK